MVLLWFRSKTWLEIQIWSEISLLRLNFNISLPFAHSSSFPSSSSCSFRLNLILNRFWLFSLSEEVFAPSTFFVAFNPSKSSAFYAVKPPKKWSKTEFFSPFLLHNSSSIAQHQLVSFFVLFALFLLLPLSPLIL